MKVDWRARNDEVADLVAGAHTTGAGYWRVDCPFCDGVVGVQDRQRSLACNAATGWWSCWRCRTRGRLRGQDFRDAEPVPDLDVTKPSPECQLPDGWVSLWRGPGCTSIMLEPARRYLERRVPCDQWCLWDVGAVLHGWAGRRIVAPVEDRNGRRVGWVGRTWLPIGVEPRRYLYPADMPRGLHLYNEAALWDDTARPLFIVEGCFDCWSLWPDACALLGKKGHHHLDILRSSTRPLVVLLDGDAWHESEAMALQLRALGRRDVSWVKLPAGTDPATVERSWIERAISPR